MPETANGLPYPPGTGVLPDVPYWLQQLAESLDGLVADSGWDTEARASLPGYTNLSSVRVRGGSATVSVHLTATSGQSAGATLEVLSGSAGPPRPHTAPNGDIWFDVISSTGAICRGRVFATGQVNLYGAPAVAGGQSLYGSVTYPVG